MCITGGLARAAAAVGFGQHALVKPAPARLNAAASLLPHGCRFSALSRVCLDPGPDTTKNPQHFERFLGLRDVFCIKEFLSGWWVLSCRRAACCAALPAGVLQACSLLACLPSLPAANVLLASSKQRCAGSLGAHREAGPRGGVFVRLQPPALTCAAAACYCAAAGSWVLRRRLCCAATWKSLWPMVGARCAARRAPDRGCGRCRTADGCGRCCTGCVAPLSRVDLRPAHSAQDDVGLLSDRRARCTSVGPDSCPTTGSLSTQPPFLLRALLMSNHREPVDAAPANPDAGFHGMSSCLTS